MGKIFSIINIWIDSKVMNITHSFCVDKEQCAQVSTHYPQTGYEPVDWACTGHTYIRHLVYIFIYGGLECLLNFKSF